MRPTPVKDTIVDWAAQTNGYPPAPLPSRYAAKSKRRAGQLEEESQALPDAHSTPLTPDDCRPLAKPQQLEATDPHTAKVVGWKSKFKRGDSFTVNGVRLVVHSIGRRCLIVRPG
jgi:hypothetical protein